MCTLCDYPAVYYAFEIRLKQSSVFGNLERDYISVYNYNIIYRTHGYTRANAVGKPFYIHRVIIRHILTRTKVVNK